MVNDLNSMLPSCSNSNRFAMNWLQANQSIALMSTYSCDDVVYGNQNVKLLLSTEKKNAEGNFQNLHWSRLMMAGWCCTAIIPIKTQYTRWCRFIWIIFIDAHRW